ncbi:hypothetical protein EBL87_15130 [Cereibacter sphaeroides]|uniref:hypothetical protein n=1 Tax=Cereibacter sphaeroides TaxID=1063 RepID=UPI000F538198|nr:hypothetical protein [Cereibacter sphaeroides]AZB65009.1 hypothetical protein EBL87_15130 [Cereibacter sphaeroides]AZB67108.1 hypothetical protein EBL86_01280 [Cereibacter sphaeroides]
MADRPIIFSAPMVRALLNGQKSQTRRVLKKRAAMNALAVFGPSFLLLPGNIDLVGCAPGDRLWVREAWTARMEHGWTIADARSRMFREEILYRADGDDGEGWWPSIRMPREFSRTTLIVTGVRVERLQDISGEDCAAEGACEFALMPPTDEEAAEGRDVFRDLWNSLHGPEAWDANPWVAAISFTVHRSNIDAMETASA